MIAHRHLPNAPIKEAIIDLRVALLEDVSVERLGGVHAKIQERFPVKKILHESRLGVYFDSQAGQPPKTIADHATLGFRYESEDGTRVVQFKLNGFTYSRLAPYTTWEEMRNEAKQLWGIFVEATSADIVTRVATRFINVIRIPLPFDDFEEYLTAPPRIPENLPQALSRFLTRIVLPNPSIDADAIITQALESVEEDYAPVVLDIDVFRRVDATESTCWDCLEELRNFKNRIFFASITGKTVELCQ